LHFHQVDTRGGLAEVEGLANRACIGVAAQLSHNSTGEGDNSELYLFGIQVAELYGELARCGVREETK
jgi:hypothetical protein